MKHPDLTPQPMPAVFDEQAHDLQNVLGGQQVETEMKEVKRLFQLDHDQQVLDSSQALADRYIDPRTLGRSADVRARLGGTAMSRREQALYDKGEAIRQQRSQKAADEERWGKHVSPEEQFEQRRAIRMLALRNTIRKMDSHQKQRLNETLDAVLLTKEGSKRAVPPIFDLWRASKSYTEEVANNPDIELEDKRMPRPDELMPWDEWIVYGAARQQGIGAEESDERSPSDVDNDRLMNLFQYLTDAIGSQRANPENQQQIEKVRSDFRKFVIDGVKRGDFTKDGLDFVKRIGSINVRIEDIFKMQTMGAGGTLDRKARHASIAPSLFGTNAHHSIQHATAHELGHDFVLMPDRWADEAVNTHVEAAFKSGEFDVIHPFDRKSEVRSYELERELAATMLRGLLVQLLTRAASEADQDGPAHRHMHHELDAAWGVTQSEGVHAYDLISKAVARQESKIRRDSREPFLVIQDKALQIVVDALHKVDPAELPLSQQKFFKIPALEKEFAKDAQAV